MRYLEFRQILKNMPLFSHGDVKKITPSISNIQLSRWERQGHIQRIIRGWYVFKDTYEDEALLSLVANKLVSPSYLSMEYVLSMYGLIPEGVYQVTSITSKKTHVYDTAIASFSYRHVKPGLMMGYQLKETQIGNVLIAELEKALLDYLYLSPQISHIDDFEGLRLNKQVLAENLDREKFMKYLNVYNQQKLTKRAEVLLYYAAH